MSKPGSRSVIIIAAIAFAAALVIVSLAFTAGSQAAFPGANGRIVYEDNGTLHIMDADGANVSRLTNGSRPSWSADGASVVFQRGGDVWVMDADGANQANITDTESFERNPAWAPDGRISFERSDLPDIGIWLMRVDGSDQVRVINQLELRPQLLEGSMSWSPDGTKIALGGMEILVVDVNEGSVAQLTDDGSPTDVSPVWSPDGSQIAWDNFDGEVHDIWVMDANGDNRFNLTDDAAAESGLDWSPDGTKIVFASRRSGDSSVSPYQIHVMNADGTCPTRISTQRGHRPRWQPIPGSAEVSPPLTCEGTSPGQMPNTGDERAGSATGNLMALGVFLAVAGACAVLLLKRPAT